MRFLLIPGLFAVAVCAGTARDDLQAIIDTVNSSGAKWKAGHSFGDNTTMSSLRRMLGVRRQPSLSLPYRRAILAQDIPDEFDARTRWPECASIRHIRDQGTCGSCWAVAAAGALSDRLCIASGGRIPLPLSQEELLSCCGIFCGAGCEGGDPERAWLFFATHGIVTGGDYQSNEGCQPYEILSCSHHSEGKLPSCDSFPVPATPKCQRRCTNPSYLNSFSSDHHKVHSAYNIRKDVAEIQREILAHGPVEADFDVYTDFLTYKSGIYHYVEGTLEGGHAVKIIGWGVENDTPYWLVANQWNESWGEKGLFRIVRGKDECGIESDIVAGVPVV